MEYNSKPETLEHIDNVRTYIGWIIKELINRSENHDQEKMGEIEKPIFDKFTPKLKNSTYGSEEYKQYLKEMKPALDHHYSIYRHHPEFFHDGIKGMNLIDLMEMIADWFAATKRHDNGDIIKSISLNQERFGYSDELKQIFTNTALYLMRTEDKVDKYFEAI